MPEIHGYADFAHTLTAALLDGTKNRNFSPISVYLALAMVAEGANGATQAELLALLGCKSLSELRGVAAGMLETLSIDEEQSTLDLHNSLWMAESINGLPVEFYESFLSELGRTYRSEAHTVAFGKKSAAEQIADWIRTQTRDKIQISQDALLFDPSTVAVLINTIYLKDNWAETFEKDRTETGDFFGPDTTRKVNYLRRYDRNSVVFLGDGWKRYRVYLTRVGYVSFVLPDEGVSLSQLLNTQPLEQLLTAGKSETFNVSLMLPKFSFQDKLELADVLTSLGLRHCFNESADFSGMSDTPCMIDRVLQESFIGVDEYGVEAAAYTMVAMRNTAFNPVERQEIDFHLTRPFLYTIETYDGEVLFIGTVTAPTAANAN